MTKCSKCGSTNFKRYVDEQVEFNYCLDCAQTGTITKRQMKKGKSEIGLSIMMIGAIVYFAFKITSLVYEPDFQNIQEVLNYTALMNWLTFIGVTLFIVGSIVQIKILLD